MLVVASSPEVVAAMLDPVEAKETLESAVTAGSCSFYVACVITHRCFICCLPFVRSSCLLVSLLLSPVDYSINISWQQQLPRRFPTISTCDTTQDIKVGADASSWIWDGAKERTKSHADSGSPLNLDRTIRTCAKHSSIHLRSIRRQTDAALSGNAGVSRVRIRKWTAALRQQLEVRTDQQLLCYFHGTNKLNVPGPCSFLPVLQLSKRLSDPQRE